MIKIGPTHSGNEALQPTFANDSGFSPRLTSIQHGGLLQ
jgi:hypothetical protein